MRRLIDQYRSLIFVLIAVAAVVCPGVQSAFRHGPKILVVKSSHIPAYKQAVEGFEQQAQPEWVIVEYDLEGTLKNTGGMINKIKEEKPDLVLAVGAKALVALTQRKVSQPIVFCTAINTMTYDTQGLDITGISLLASPKDQLEILRKLNPKIEKVGVLLRKRESANLLTHARNLARKHSLKLLPIEIGKEEEIPRKLRPVLNSVDALWMLDDAFIHSKESLEFVVLNSIENELPFMAISEAFVEGGALVSLSPSFFGNGKQAAKLVKKILAEKSSPRNIPISFHENPELVINLKIAEKTGLTISNELLGKATKTYK